VEGQHERQTDTEMTITFSATGGAPVDVLAETEELYARAARGLFRVIAEMETGAGQDGKAAQAATRDLKAALEMVMSERARVDKFRERAEGAVGAGCLDLDAARDEIGRRLARLRAAGGGG
jgi:predicted alternative tryptophan synthase beta-subunit